MAKPIVAIVGRPNVGKSTLFNRLAEKRVSIVDDTPGATRDRIYADAEWTGHLFTLIDTGGIDFNETDELLPAMRKQASSGHGRGRCHHFRCGRKSRHYPGGHGNRGHPAGNKETGGAGGQQGGQSEGYG